MLHPFPAPELTITKAARALRAGRLSALSLVQQCLDAIDARDEVVRAWVCVDRASALEQARLADERISFGEPLGPLHGIPFGIKDIIDVAGFPTCAGMEKALSKVPTRDAPIVERLRRAGAIILGKTVTTPYAWIDPPPTTNPWNPARTPGGSSSGSAAALAAGMCLGALGSQTGGSLNRPAAFCGVASLKPTYGRLSTRGIFPFAPSLDHPGPLARSAADLAIVWRALTHEDPPPKKRRRAPRIGRLAGIFHRHADPDARLALTQFLRRVRSAGATTSNVRLPRSFLPGGYHRVIMASEAAVVHSDRFAHHPELYPPKITELLREGESMPATAYITALNKRDPMRDDVLRCFEDLDALVTPAARGAAPDRSTTGDPVMNSPWSYLGLPTVSIPVALSSEGLPLAVQLIGRYGGESALLQTAIWCEAALAR